MNKKFALRDDNQTKAYLLLETIRGINLRLNYIAVLQEIEKQLLTEGGSTMTLDSLLGPMDAFVYSNVLVGYWKMSKFINSVNGFWSLLKPLRNEDLFDNFLCNKLSSGREERR